MTNWSGLGSAGVIWAAHSSISAAYSLPAIPFVFWTKVTSPRRRRSSARKASVPSAFLRDWSKPRHARKLCREPKNAE